MAEYRYLFYDLVANTRLGELELTGVRYSRALNTAGSLVGAVQLGDPRVLARDPIGITAPIRTRVYVERDGVLQWGGIIWTRRYNDSNRTLELGAKELWSYFQTRNAVGRYVTDTLTWTGQDQLGIVRDLIAYAQGQALTSVDGGPLTYPKPGGNLGIVLGSEVSNVLRDRSWTRTSYQDIAAAVEDMAAVYLGFDFAIDVAYVSGVPTATLVLSYPRRGRTVSAGTGVVFEKPGNILAFSWPEDGTSFATTSYALGDGEGDAMQRSSASRPDLIDAGYPFVEQRYSYKGQGINQQGTLDAHARADVEAAATAFVLPALTVRADGSTPVGSYTVGDDARLRITDDRFPNPGYGGADQHLDTYARIIAYEVSAPTASSEEQVTVTLGATA